MAKRIIILCLALFIGACTITITNDSGGGVSVTGGVIRPVQATPTVTSTPRAITVISITNTGTRLRSLPSTNSSILAVIPQGTSATVNESRVIGAYTWYNITYSASSSTTMTGWVRNDVVNTPVRITATPSNPTPTREIGIVVPPEGIVGYSCMQETCKNENLVLTFYDRFDILFNNGTWAWICVLAQDGTCNRARQFYVRVNE